jgi:hypothetical protein
MLSTSKQNGQKKKIEDQHQIKVLKCQQETQASVRNI